MNGIVDRAIFNFLRRCKSPATRVLCISFLALAGVRTQATDITWIAGDGLYETSNNWSTGMVPTAADRAIFNDSAISSPYAVTFSASESLGNALFSATNQGVLWKPSGFTWRVNSSFVLDQDVSATATGVFRNGTITATNAMGTATFQVGRYATGSSGLFKMEKEAVGDTPTLIADDFLVTSNAVFICTAGTLTTLHGSTIDRGTNALLGALGNVTGDTATWNMLGGTNSITYLGGVGTNTLGFGPNGSAFFNVNVVGSSTMWNIGGARLGVGWNGSASLVISNGAKVTSPPAQISANGTTSTNNAVTVTGTGSQWSVVGGSLTVGSSAQNNTLTIANGGVVSTDDRCYVGGGNGGSSNNTVLVTGAGSQMTIAGGGGTLAVGYATPNNTMTISNGGGVSAGYLYLGQAGGTSNSFNNTLVVTGNNSTLSAGSGDARLGNYAPGNQMTISAGAVVSCFGMRLGDETNSANNVLTVDGSNSYLNLTLLFNVGGYGSNNTVNITNGGRIDCTSASSRMGNLGPSSANNAVVIDGTNSVWNALGGYTVGQNSSGNRVTIRNGGLWNTGSSDFIVGVNSYAVTIGNNASLANNNVVTVQGPGSHWVNYDALNLGNSGSGNQLIVTNGGAVDGLAPTNMIVGSSSASLFATNNALIVTGVGSYLNFNGELRVGNGGRNNQMTISSGGVVSDTAGWVGNVGSNTTAVVTGAGSVWSNSTLLQVGGNGSNNTLLITAGGLVNNSGTLTRAGNGTFAYNNAIIIDGTNSLLNSAPNLTVGGSGPANTVTVKNGGRLNTGNGSGSASLGISATASNNVVTVDGPGSLWVNQSGMNVGSLGSYNQLIVTNGGEVQTQGLTVSPTAGGASNSVLVFNGTLAVTNVANSGVLNVGGGGSVGTFTFSGGTMFVDQLFLTNGTASVFTFNQGVLNVLSSQVAKASAFVVGDGSSVARLNLLGTSHSFANGLTISSNATLSGIGTIIGNVTLANGATWAPGSSAGTQTVVGVVSLNPGTILNYELGGPGNPGDLINITGNLTLDGTLNVSNLGGFGAGDYTLMTYTGALTDNGLLVGTTPIMGLSYSIIAGGGSVVLHVTGGGPAPGSYDAWAQSYFGSTNCALCGGAADPDGDGMSNSNEFLAGFAPNNSAAYLHIIAIAKTGSDIKVTYLGANGDNTYSGGPASRTNVLEYATGTANGSYSNNFVSTGQTNILNGGTGTGVVTNMTDIGGATGATRYYRVRVLVP